MDYIKLDEIATNFRYGKMPDKNKITKNGTYPIWSGYRYVGYYTEKNVNKNEIIVVARGVGGTGDVKICKEDCFLTNLSIAFEVNENINPLYIYYYCKIKNLRYLDSGSAQSQITINDLKNVKFPIPNKKVQDKIVEVLNRIDQKIELNNEITNNLQEISSNLYKHYFIDNNDYDYEEKKLSEIASKIVTGKTPSTSKEEYWGGNIPFVTIPDMHNDMFTINTERYLTEEGNNSQKKKLVPRNSIMVSCIATVGLVSINSSPSHTNQQINSIIIKNDYELYFLYENMKTRTDELKGIGSSGTSTLNVNKGEFEKLVVKYPTKEILLEFDKAVRPLFNKMEELQKENLNLEQLRNTLLPKLMNGEIDLDNIEI